MKAERVVLDTNVLISAALRRDGRPRAVVDAVREERGVLLFSDETFDELRTRLLLPKFDRYVSPDGRAVYLAQLEAVSEWVPIAGAKLGCRDPDDDKVLETAPDGRGGLLGHGGPGSSRDVSVPAHSDTVANGVSGSSDGPITVAHVNALEPECALVDGEGRPAALAERADPAAHVAGGALGRGGLRHRGALRTERRGDGLAIESCGLSRHHFPGLIQPPRHRPLELPQDLHRAFKFMVAVVGAAEAAVWKRRTPAISLSLANEEDDVGAA